MSNLADLVEVKIVTSSHSHTHTSRQVDATGKAWVAGSTFSSLDGNTNAGGDDVFLMTFDRDGNHLWTRQRGGWSMDRALDLQVLGP